MSASIIQFPRHAWEYSSRDDYHVEYPPSCSRCGSFEGATTSDCPGARMTGQQIDLVYEGKLDYRHPVGWTHRPSEIWQKWR